MLVSDGAKSIMWNKLNSAKNSSTLNRSLVVNSSQFNVDLFNFNYSVEISEGMHYQHTWFSYKAEDNRVIIQLNSSSVQVLFSSDIVTAIKLLDGYK